MVGKGEINFNMQIVTAAVIEKDGNILIAKRKKGDPLENKWEFPGGKLKPSETPEGCLKRELREEFDIDAEVGVFIGSSTFAYKHLSIELLAYRVARTSGVFEVKVHEEIRWVPPEELSQYNFSEADQPIVRKIMAEI